MSANILHHPVPLLGVIARSSPEFPDSGAVESRVRATRSDPVWSGEPVVEVGEAASAHEDSRPVELPLLYPEVLGQPAAVAEEHRDEADI